MTEPLIVAFYGTTQTPRTLVGGKAASLIAMAAAGLPVPPGAVVTTAFFTPWFDEIKALPAWARLSGASADDWPALCSELKQFSQTLLLTSPQQEALSELRRELAGDEAYFAVRSSSPEEDLASASFAGSYATCLGVRLDELENALRTCFASSLDLRVLSYKKERGLDYREPRIAVIVQRQIDSEVSGVAFSLNPLSNDYDEAVIDSNWGLGSAVVDGRVSPDHFVVNKLSGEVIEEALGEKGISEWLDSTGGISEKASNRSKERSLTDAQLRELTDMVGRVETLYAKPVDIEWAYAEGTLHLLQARPVTTYVPLPPEMITEPEERRRLYVDAALSKGLTTNKPISPLGSDFMKRPFSTLMESLIGPFEQDPPPDKALLLYAGGRMYMNLSNVLWLVSPAKMAKSSAPTDALMAETLASIDPAQYRSSSRPPWISLRLLWLIPRLVWRLRSFLWNSLRALFAPERARRVYQQTVDAFQRDMRGQLQGSLSPHALAGRYEGRFADELFNTMMSVVVVGLLNPRLAVLGKNAETKALADTLRQGSADNVVTGMGIALYRLAKLLDKSDLDNLDHLAERIERRQFSAEFLSAWDDFIANYGWRGPMEMDLASPRYGDDPRLALHQLSSMATDDENYSPEAAHQHLMEARQQAYEQLLARLGPVRRSLLRWVYRRITLFAGTRDTPKHILVLFGYAVRKAALAQGQYLVRNDRLDAAEDIFGLTFADLEAAARDSTLNLRERHKERTHFHKKLDAHVRTFPAVIDSRGRIMRPPPRQDAPGVLSGMPVSPGKVTGPVKVLNSPDEKPVAKGDILVAYTTDPGWTPLFVNAAAIVLEVGGVLQHGAVVAREYGKPCVVGIDRVMQKLRDGDAVEVDGAMGTIRVLSRDDAAPALNHPEVSSLSNRLCRVLSK